MTNEYSWPAYLPAGCCANITAWIGRSVLTRVSSPRNVLLKLLISETVSAHTSEVSLCCWNVELGKRGGGAMKNETLRRIWSQIYKQQHCMKNEKGKNFQQILQDCVQKTNKLDLIKLESQSRNRIQRKKFLAELFCLDLSHFSHWLSRRCFHIYLHLSFDKDRCCKYDSV